MGIDIVRALPAAHIGTRTRPDAAIRGGSEGLTLSFGPVGHRAWQDGRYLTAREAVVRIECQQGILGKKSILPDLQRDSAALVPAIGLLLDAARTSSATVVHATLEGPLDGEPSGTARVWRSMGPATRDWTPGPSPLGSPRRCMRPAIS
ncbi:cysteine hydrolase family protein [Williamsia muralis]|uniref:Uncharacterized protein n=1 Tax=Williamsia marianensis TaxID=85044 RepID=A0ABU4EZ36_WILMA|nr:hypothetical protein [Williamsia muralis]MDV7136498.1 hypothetical protein [Williamsia muralis]